jgi:hypothetical protein
MVSKGDVLEAGGWVLRGGDFLAGDGMVWWSGNLCRMIRASASAG